MADIGLSAFSVFFMGSPSFLAHQRALEEGQGRSNCQTLFGMTAVPSDAYIRLMLDGASPAAFDPLFFKTIETEGVLAPFQRLGGRTLIALDGTEHFCSRKIHCKRCSTRRRSDGGTEYFHSFLGASIVAPGHSRVLPLPPEFVAPQDGAEKQDCERNAAKRWLAWHGPAVAQLRPVYLGDDLFACQPIAEAIHRVGGSFILTCKPASHQTVSEYLRGASLEEHRRTEIVRGRRTTTIYRWLSEVPLRATDDALAVTWVSIEIHNAAGKRTYYNSFVTDLDVNAGNVAELAACGRRAGTLVPAKAGSRTKRSTCSKPTDTTSSTTSGTARRHWPASSSSSIYSPLGSIPPPCSRSWPGVRQSSHGAQHTGPSSTCERSPPTSYSRTGIICSAPSPPPRHDHPDETPNGHALTFTTIVRANLTYRSI